MLTGSVELAETITRSATASCVIDSEEKFRTECGPHFGRGNVDRRMRCLDRWHAEHALAPPCYYAGAESRRLAVGLHQTPATSPAPAERSATSSSWNFNVAPGRAEKGHQRLLAESPRLDSGCRVMACKLFTNQSRGEDLADRSSKQPKRY